MLGIKKLKTEICFTCYFCKESAHSKLYGDTTEVYLCDEHRHLLELMFVQEEKKIEVPESILWELVKRKGDSDD